MQSKIRSVLNRSTLSCAFAALLAFASAPAAAYADLYVFGDSLSDNGNLYALSGNTVPQLPYFGGRFSNGPVAVEVLANGLGATLHVLAIAGAQTSTAGLFPNTGMLSQLASYSSALGGASADPSALYFVWGGANDLRDAGAGAAAAIAPAVGNLTTIVSSLYNLGARDFLLPNLPDLGLTAEAVENGLMFAGGATFLSEAFNTNLGAAYTGLASTLIGAKFIYFDVMASQRAVVAGVGTNGFNNVTERCFDTRNPLAVTLCATPDTYLSWDNIHPTAAAHAILGNQMLAAVPEPTTMLMMSVGVLVLVGVSRRRQA